MIDAQIRIKDTESAGRSQKQQPEIQEMNPAVQMKWTPKVF